MIRRSNFEEVEHYWYFYLWPLRKSIKPMSDMTYLGGHDRQIYEKYKPSFFVFDIDEEVVAVNSCHKSSDHGMRSRGLWVKPEYRRQGITRKLFDAIFDEALSQQCKYVWSLPRKTALAAYEASGFVKTSHWLETETSEANCYVRKML